MKKRIASVLAGAALAALLAVPMAASDPIPTGLGSATGLTSDEMEALGIPWDAALEDWSTAFATSSTQCTGVLPPGTYENVTVPPGMTCTINATHYITHDVTVLDGASLLDGGPVGGAFIGHDLRAKNPYSIIIESGTVGHDIHIQGTTGMSPFNLGDNWICNQEVGHDVVVQKSASTAGRWVIGDNGEGFYAGCGNSIAHDLVVKDNANRVDVGGHNPSNGLTTVAGIGHDLRVANNRPALTRVTDNDAGHDCTQSNNSPYAGAGNTAGNNNNCNTAY